MHTPFCPSKCGYCDFNSYALNDDMRAEDIVQRTTDATIREIKNSPWKGRPAKTIFFGGGTPTYLSESQLISILEAVFRAHPPIEGCEITSEANPGTADFEKFAAMRRAGFNRLSLGAQSFLDTDLITLGRVHKSGEIERAVGVARDAGFDNLNLDLMFALPNQSVHAWHKNLDRALALDPEHLSLYCLNIEPNTAFYKKRLRGEITVPDDEQQVAMYDDCLSRMATAGFEQYEISNFAKPGRACRHNLEYWYGHEYAAYGPGAVGQVGGVRYTNLKHPVAYSQATAPLFFESETLTPEMQNTERIMLGLRLNEGIPRAGLSESAIAEMSRRSWVTLSEDRVQLTPLGRHYCSEVALELID